MLIDRPERARQLARAIASDLALYHEEKILTGLENDNLYQVLAEEIDEGRQLYNRRVAPDLLALNLYDRAIVDVLVKSKGHVRCKLW